MGNKVVLNQAKTSDLGLIEGMLYETASWLKSIGSKQWNGVLEGKDNHNTPQAIERGEVFYCTINDEPVGMFILWSNQSEWDAQLWGAEDSSQYFYLHRLNLVRKFSGQGIANEILAEIKAYSQKKGKSGVRLDCISSNAVLNKLYQSADFAFLKTIYDHDAGEQVADFNLYQYDCK